VQWAYVGWQPTTALNIKAGRSVAPLFLMSDYRDVYYSQISARPNGAIYYNNPITFNDGLSAQWDYRARNDTFTLEAYFGKTDVKVAQGAVDVPHQGGLSLKWGRGPFSMRAGTSFARANFAPTPGGFAAQFLHFVQLGQTLGLCSNCQAVDATRLQTYSHTHSRAFAMVWDDGDIALQGEYTARYADSLLIGSSRGWYLQAARHLGEWTPYASIGRFWPTSAPIGLVANAPPNPSAVQQQVLDTIATANATNLNGKYNRGQDALGVRWDFRQNMALKLQWDRYRLDNPRWGSGGTVSYAMGAGAPPFSGRVNAYTLNLDFIF
jgi:hypothetical protein